MGFTVNNSTIRVWGTRTGHLDTKAPQSNIDPNLRELRRIA